MCDKQEYLMAYLAGVMDGDGSFSIIRQKGAKNPWHVAMLQCANLSKKIVDMLLHAFGGDIGIRKPFLLKSGKFSQPLHRWKAQGAEKCHAALEKLIPFLVIKKERAEFLLKFILAHPFRRGMVMSPEEVHLREKAHAKMIAFNEDRNFSGISKRRASAINEDPSFWAYVAGLMDTDGSFCVKRQTKNDATPGVKNHRYSVVIQLSFADCKAINFLRRNIPWGKSYVATNKAATNGFHYTWNISGKEEALKFLDRVIPFLVFKKENAQVLHTFCKGFIHTGYCKIGVDPEQLRFREECYQNLVYLNKNGVSKPSLIDSDALELGNEAQAGEIRAG